jgi:hypothetical protein
MAAKRHIDEQARTVTIEFSNGQMFGPIEWNPTIDVLTSMIGSLDGRLNSLEAKIARLGG